MPDIKSRALLATGAGGLPSEDISRALADSLEPALNSLNKVLLIPPDYTRLHANAGLITESLYGLLSPRSQVDILPALGTHVPVSEKEWGLMFPGIPIQAMRVHNWRTDLVRLGEVPAGFVREVSGGLMDAAIPVEVNRHLVEGGYDLILSIGQVVPHEVVGMANHSKNILVGCGGTGMINASHMLGALYGMERIMGRPNTPVRKVLDYASEHLLSSLPIHYILTVTDAPGGVVRTHGLFMGPGREGFERAAALAQQVNITWLERPVNKAVVYLDGLEFKSTWLGNKAVYRTRMALEDGGELLVLAPGVDRFGEDPAVDALIRKYGYRGRDSILGALKTTPDLQASLSAAAHLIHGSSEGRFTITYCPQHLTQDEVEGVGYAYLPYQEAVRRYPPDRLQEGFNTLPDGGEVYFIRNPALGLWVDQSRHSGEAGFAPPVGGTA